MISYLPPASMPDNTFNLTENSTWNLELKRGGKQLMIILLTEAMNVVLEEQ